jgi:hypothetical protein
MDKEKIWADGFSFSLPSPAAKEKAPWIKGKIGVQVEQAIAFLQKHKNSVGYVNIDLKLGKTGNYYLELNDWKPIKKPTEEDAERAAYLKSIEVTGF